MLRDASLSQSVKCPTSVQVMILQFVSSSPASGYLLSSAEPTSDPLSPSLCLLPGHVPSLSLSLSLSLSKLISKHLKEKKRKKLLRTSDKEKLLKQPEEKDTLHKKNKEIVNFIPKNKRQKQKQKHESQKTIE